MFLGEKSPSVLESGFFFERKKQGEPTTRTVRPVSPLSTPGCQPTIAKFEPVFDVTTKDHRRNTILRNVYRDMERERERENEGVLKRERFLYTHEHAPAGKKALVESSMMRAQRMTTAVVGSAGAGRLECCRLGAEGVRLTPRLHLRPSRPQWLSLAQTHEAETWAGQRRCGHPRSSVGLHRPFEPYPTCLALGRGCGWLGRSPEHGSV